MKEAEMDGGTQKIGTGSMAADESDGPEENLCLALFVVYGCHGFIVRPSRFAIKDVVQRITIGRLDASDGLSDEERDMPILEPAASDDPTHLRLRLPAKAVSGTHARLLRTLRGFTLEDLGSRHGTRLCKTGTKGGALELEAHEPRSVALGDWFSVGPVILMLDEVSWPAEVVGAGSAREATRLLRTLLPSLELSVALFSKAKPPIRTLLITGEAGTGKEGFARAFHQLGPHSHGTFEPVACATLDPNRAPSELFGHLAGAFADARDDHRGALLRADGGTAFLDDVDTLPGLVQPQLLRAVQERRVLRMRARREERTDFHLVAATNADLPQLVVKGEFRDDLYARLVADGLLALPSFPDRRMDFGIVVENLLDNLRQDSGCPDLRLSVEASLALMMHAGGGRNVRGLQAALGRAVRKALAKQDGGSRSFIGIGDIAKDDRKVIGETVTVPTSADELRALLDSCGGNYSVAARACGVSRRWIGKLRKKFGVE